MTELAYDERTTNFSTTSTTLFAVSGVGAADPLIGGLDVTVTGTGAAVEVEFYTPAMGNTASALVTSWFVVSVGAGFPEVKAATSQFRNWATVSSSNTGGTMRRRLVLDNGVAYKFQVGVAASAASITTSYGAVSSGGTTVGVTYLRVTG